MATPHNVKIVEICRVGPPPGAVPDAVLPLTFSDVLMTQLGPVPRLFFYQFPTHPAFTTALFVNDLLPNLKHSLSLALQSFFPLAANLTSSTSGEYEIRYMDGDTVCLTISESEANFHRLKGNDPRQITELTPLIPPLQTPNSQKQPLLAVQITIFPGAGICLGTSVRHVVADGSSYIHFMKSWASICRLDAHDSLHISPPFHDRTVLAPLDGLKRRLLDQMGSIKLEEIAKSIKPPGTMELATFVIRKADIEKLRQRVLAQARKDGKKPLRCSSFVLACSYVWVCEARAYDIDSVEDKTFHFSFAADCRARLDPPIPSAYFGNCLGMCLIHAKGRELAAEDGMRHATEIMGEEIQGLNGGGFLKGAEDWLPRAATLASERVVATAGSPKLRVYETDFGWGRPMKVEVLSVAELGGISLAESRDEEGGIEFGVALTKSEMERFAFLFEEGLKPMDPQ